MAGFITFSRFDGDTLFSVEFHIHSGEDTKSLLRNKAILDAKKLLMQNGILFGGFNNLSLELQLDGDELEYIKDNYKNLFVHKTAKVQCFYGDIAKQIISNIFNGQ